MKDEKIGITCEEALKAFSDLGEALRKEMVQPEKKSSLFKPQFIKYAYYCPECDHSTILESECTTVICEKCSHVFDPRLLEYRNDKPTEDSTTIPVNEAALAADVMSKLTSEKKITIKEEVKKAIVNLFKPFVDEIISFDEAVRKMNEDAEKTEIEDIQMTGKFLMLGI